jgi:hypothetical protein
MNLISGRIHERSDTQVDYWSQSDHGGSGGRTRKSFFRDGTISDPFDPELLDILLRTEDSRLHVGPHDENTLVAAHLFGLGFVDRLRIADLRHARYLTL